MVITKLSEYPVLNKKGLDIENIYAIQYNEFKEYIKLFGLTVKDFESFRRGTNNIIFFAKQRGSIFKAEWYLIDWNSKFEYIKDEEHVLVLFEGYDGKFYGKRGKEVEFKEYLSDLIEFLSLSNNVKKFGYSSDMYEYLTKNHEKVDEFIDEDSTKFLDCIKYYDENFQMIVDTIKLDEGFKDLIESGILEPIKPNISFYLSYRDFRIYFNLHECINYVNFKYKDHIINVTMRNGSKYYEFRHFCNIPVSTLYYSVYNSVTDKYEKMGIKKPNNISIGKGTEKRVLFTLDYIVSTEDKVRREINRRVEERKIQRQKLLDAGFSCSPFESFTECTEHNIGNEEKWTKYEDDRDLYVTLDIDNRVDHSFIQHRITDYEWPI
ncbi:MAG: hypothetical protein J5767_12460 [Paludibacteraceae bacterium]|nr:hypothetical protein [Paludibacteraceae bacterium]